MVDPQIQQLLDIIRPQISPAQQQQLMQYADLLQQYNQKLNLISRRDIPRVWENHIFPSILANSFVDFPLGAAVADLGSGGGLPGIPLKIIRPDLKLVLIDSSRKKTAFLRQVVYLLGIKQSEVLQARLTPREINDMLRNRFKVVMARAVAGFRELWELSGPLLEKNGFMLTWKGESDLTELQQLAPQINIRYQVGRIPEEFWKFSPKLSQLCFVQIWPEYSSPESGNHV
ncbi:MAG: 16S rRNA (guanine(527)-N(7))-methyltransferase RsmG [bacterium]|nr:MAG: 16S rRNA (guanine(527)-N(7))-methyltransferase RsmG [bacterium]